jgi:hypothetical protein
VGTAVSDFATFTALLEDAAPVATSVADSTEPFACCSVAAASEPPGTGSAGVASCGWATGNTLAAGGVLAAGSGAAAAAVRAVRLPFADPLWAPDIGGVTRTLAGTLLFAPGTGWAAVSSAGAAGASLSASAAGTEGSVAVAWTG